MVQVDYPVHDGTAFHRAKQQAQERQDQGAAEPALHSGFQGDPRRKQRNCAGRNSPGGPQPFQYLARRHQGRPVTSRRTRNTQGAGRQRGFQEQERGASAVRNHPVPRPLPEDASPDSFDDRTDGAERRHQDRATKQRTAQERHVHRDDTRPAEGLTARHVRGDTHDAHPAPAFAAQAAERLHYTWRRERTTRNRGSSVLLRRL